MINYIPKFPLKSWNINQSRNNSSFSDNDLPILWVYGQSPISFDRMF